MKTPGIVHENVSAVIFSEEANGVVVNAKDTNDNVDQADKEKDENIAHDDEKMIANAESTHNNEEALVRHGLLHYYCVVIRIFICESQMTIRMKMQPKQSTRMSRTRIIMQKLLPTKNTLKRTIKMSILHPKTAMLIILTLSLPK